MLLVETRIKEDLYALTLETDRFPIENDYTVIVGRNCAHSLKYIAMCIEDDMYDRHSIAIVLDLLADKVAEINRL